MIFSMKSVKPYASILYEEYFLHCLSQEYPSFTTRISKINLHHTSSALAFRLLLPYISEATLLHFLKVAVQCHHS